jgi:transcriptional regulator with XRE-family HTH domain
VDKIRELRIERGLSQAKLAARAEVDPSTINQIERGARNASPLTLRKLAQALGVGLAELLQETDSPKALRRSSPEPSLFNGDEDERHVPKLADAADLLLKFAHMLLLQWEEELPRRAEADDDEWLAKVAVMWRAFGLANYAVLEELGADGLHDKQEWFAMYMDVNAAIHRLNATIRAHSDSGMVPDELLLEVLPTTA